jgi:hypothetical protein
MLLDLVTSNVWGALGLWAIVYIADYALTLRGARLYSDPRQTFVRFDGSYELNPVFERDVDARRRLSRRFVILLGVTCALIWLLWRIAQSRILAPAIFPFWMGVLLLIELPVLLRHLRNIATFRWLLRAPDVRGQIVYPRWFSLRLSAGELAAFTALYLLLSPGPHTAFFLGGAGACAMTAFQHWGRSERLRMQASTAAPNAAPAAPAERGTASPE